jgi:SAM-dependent methyltransferase
VRGHASAAQAVSLGRTGTEWWDEAMLLLEAPTPVGFAAPNWLRTERELAGGRQLQAAGRMVITVLDRARAVWGIARAGHPTARLRVLRDGMSSVRAAILASGIISGVLPALADGPDDVPGLARRLGVTEGDLLAAFLGVLASARLVDERAGRWRTSKRARAVLDDPVARAAAVAFGGYYTELYRGLADQLCGGPARTDLDDHAETIAAISGAMQPLVEQLIRTAVEQVRPSRVLDVGCGNGDQLALMLTTAGTAATGLGVESAPDVARTAEQRLATAGLGARATVLAMDAADLPKRIHAHGGPVDLMLLANVVYYVPTRQQADFLTRLRPLLRPGGTLLIITTVASDDLFARHFDLLLRAQGRGIAVPRLAQLIETVRQAGYTHIDSQRAAAGTPFIALCAARP